MKFHPMYIVPKYCCPTEIKFDLLLCNCVVVFGKFAQNIEHYLFYLLFILRKSYPKSFGPKVILSKKEILPKGNLSQWKFVQQEILPKGNLTQRKVDPRETWSKGKFGQTNTVFIS